LIWSILLIVIQGVAPKKHVYLVIVAYFMYTVFHVTIMHNVTFSYNSK